MEKITELTHLLQRAGAAHGEYETTILNGVYDENWPQWYAQWAIEHGLNDLLFQPFEVQKFSQVLFEINEAHKASDQRYGWAEFTARSLAER